MTRSLILAATTVAVWGMAASASAERMTLRCTQGLSESYEVYGNTILNETSIEDDILLEMDTNTGDFSIGSTQGRFTLNDSVFIGMAHAEPFYASWDIDRATGRMIALGHVDLSGNWVMMRREGVCHGPSGEPGF